MFTFSGLIFLIDTLVWTAFVIKCFQILKDEPYNSTTKHFLITFLILDVAYFIFFLSIFSASSNLPGVATLKIIGDFILYLSFSYGTKIPVTIRYPKFNANILVASFVAVSIITTVFNCYYPPHPTFGNLGIMHWNLNNITAWGLYPVSLGMWFPMAYIFYKKGLEDLSEQARYWILATGFVITSFFGPLTVVVKTDFWTAFAQVMMSIGHTILLIGLVYKKKT